MERKSQEILFDLSVNNKDWEQTAFRLCGKYFGSHINKEPFELLTHLLNYKIILKHTENVFQMEALLFGTAGLLNKEFKERYPKELQKEYNFLKHKYRLSQLEAHQWQFLRIRPVSFPTIRIAWFAQLMKQMPLFSKMITQGDTEQLLSKIEVSAYWSDHYIFDKQSKFKTKKIGDDFKAVLQINVFATILYAYGKFSNEKIYIDKAIELLYKTPKEENVKTKIFEPPHWQLQNAFHTQAVIELYDNYCIKKRCLECSIGHKILRN